MKFKKLVRQIRREAKTHPKKVAVLGLLFAVALVIWVPKTWRMMHENATIRQRRTATAAPSAPAGAGAQTENPASDGALGAAARPEAAVSWRQIAEWIANDPKMSPPSSIRPRRDPLAGAAKVTAQPQTAEPPDTQKPPEITPKSAGLVLSSTLIGSHRRVALINGNVYAEGGTVPAGDVTFVVASVHSEHIILERNGKQFELAIERAPQSGKIRLERLRN